MTQSDYDHREEGESLFEWPLDSAGMRMGAGDWELFDLADEARSAAVALLRALDGDA